MDRGRNDGIEYNKYQPAEPECSGSKKLNSGLFTI